MKHTVWQELTHASHLQSMKNYRGYTWASNYWSTLIALAEGWAYFREYVLANWYLGKNLSEYQSSLKYPNKNYEMFLHLLWQGCSYHDMEKALSDTC